MGIVIFHPQLLNAQDTRLTQEYLSKTIGKVKEKHNIPAIAVSVMNSEKLFF
jgi:hypothetical protein